MPGPRAAVSVGSGAGVLVGWKPDGYSYGEGAGAGGGQKAAGQGLARSPPRPADSHRLALLQPDPGRGSRHPA